MKHYLIYQIRNKLNGMIYIGQHQTENVNDGYMGSGILITRAIEKYGLENFEKTNLFECKSEAEMNAKEAEIVNKDFIARDDVYNMAIGGFNWSSANKRYTKERRSADMKKFFDSMTDDERKHYFQLKTKLYYEWWNNLSECQKSEFSDKVSNGIKNHIKKYGALFANHKHSDETKNKISAAKKGKCCGKANSMHGKIWICNDKTHESKTHLSSLPIPEGWRKGRFCKK